MMVASAGGTNSNLACTYLAQILGAYNITEFYILKI